GPAREDGAAAEIVAGHGPVGEADALDRYVETGDAARRIHDEDAIDIGAAHLDGRESDSRARDRQRLGLAAEYDLALRKGIGAGRDIYRIGTARGVRGEYCFAERTGAIIVRGG